MPGAHRGSWSRSIHRLNERNSGYTATDFNDHFGYRTVEQVATGIAWLFAQHASGPTGDFYFGKSGASVTGGVRDRCWREADIRQDATRGLGAKFAELVEASALEPRRDAIEPKIVPNPCALIISPLHSEQYPIFLR
jgi:hypothetical protein